MARLPPYLRLHEEQAEPEVLRELRSQGKIEYQGKKIKGSDRNIYLESEPRAELKARMIDGRIRVPQGHPKFKYIHFAGDKHD